MQSVCKNTTSTSTGSGPAFSKNRTLLEDVPVKKGLEPIKWLRTINALKKYLTYTKRSQFAEFNPKSYDNIVLLPNAHEFSNGGKTKFQFDFECKSRCKFWSRNSLGRQNFTHWVGPSSRIINFRTELILMLARFLVTTLTPTSRLYVISFYAGTAVLSGVCNSTLTSRSG